MHEPPALQLLRLVHIDRIRSFSVVLKVHNRAAFGRVVPEDIPQRAVVGSDVEAPYLPVVSPGVVIRWSGSRLGVGDD